MKYRNWLLGILITAPLFLGCYGYKEMTVMAFVAVIGKIGGIPLFGGRSIEWLFNGSFYRLGLSGKRLTIRTPDNRLIVKEMRFCMAFRGSDNRIKKIVPVPEKIIFDDVTSKLTVYYASDWYGVDLCFALKKDSPVIGCDVIMRCFPLKDHPLRHDDGKIYLEYASVDCKFPLYLKVKTFFLKNRTTLERGVIFPVWLDKQGLTLGRGQRVFHLYHLPGISSLLYMRWPHRLRIFIDHSHDHRFVTVAEKEDKLVYVDGSNTAMEADYHHACHFSFQAGHAPIFQPVLWMHALGHDATLIWSEHPDNNQLGTSLAVALGDSSLAPDEKPVGGFAFHQIPVTKGVFYTTDNHQNISLFDHPDSNVYRKLIDILCADYGYEITMHTVSSHSLIPDRTEEALAFMKLNYGNSNWIDHSAHVRPEALSGTGSHSDSPRYIIDLLREQGVKYAWHYGSELKYLPGRDLHDDAKGLNLLKWSKDLFACEHTPLYWRHPSRLGDIITWKSMVMGRLRHFPITGFQWLVWFLQHLPPLVRQHGVCIVHDYPAWHYEKKHADGNGIYVRKKDSGGNHFIIDPDFDHLLKHLAMLNKNRELHCTTVKQFLDYQCALEKLEFDYHPSGAVTIRNTGKDDLAPVLAFSDRFRPSGIEWIWIRDTEKISLYKLMLKGDSSIMIDFS